MAKVREAPPEDDYADTLGPKSGADHALVAGEHFTNALDSLQSSADANGSKLDPDDMAELTEAFQKVHAPLTEDADGAEESAAISFDKLTPQQKAQLKAGMPLEDVEVGNSKSKREALRERGLPGSLSIKAMRSF